MIYTLRIYHMHPGRTPAIHQRFSEHTLGLFQKHGIHVCDFWQDDDGEARIYYMCAFADREERERKWHAFTSDPAWLAVKSASEQDGPIVAKIENYFLSRVPYITPEWPQSL